MFDVVLRGGWIVDGSSAPPFRADLGIGGDRIAEIGRLDGASAATELDCTDLYVTPGFVDAHVHGDARAGPRHAGRRPSARCDDLPPRTGRPLVRSGLGRD